MITRDCDHKRLRRKWKIRDIRFPSWFFLIIGTCLSQRISCKGLLIETNRKCIQVYIPSSISYFDAWCYLSIPMLLQRYSKLIRGRRISLPGVWWWVHLGSLWLTRQGHSEPAPTNAPSTGCLLWLSCEWSSTELPPSFILVTLSVRSRSNI